MTINRSINKQTRLLHILGRSTALTLSMIGFFALSSEFLVAHAETKIEKNHKKEKHNDKGNKKEDRKEDRKEGKSNKSTLETKDQKSSVNTGVNPQPSTQNAPLTTAQIQALKPADIAALPTSQITALTQTQIQALTYLQLEAVLLKLSPTQVGWLTFSPPNQLAAVVTDLTAAQLRGLTSTQIQNMPPNQLFDIILQLQPIQLGFLSSDQKSNLKGRMAPSQIDAFSSNMPPDQKTAFLNALK